MMEKSLKDLALVLAASLRPVLLDADELENFDKLIFREGFRISVGEYMDWQNLVFAIAPRCDIEDSNETDLRYQRVENKNYGGITFKDKDMSRAKFIHCSFQNCIFQNVSLREARFVNCRWKDVVLRNGSMETTGFINCSLVNFDAATMNTDGAYVRDCVMENVKLD
jgi:uncharacterized protein YjbI with pentapeptide repeats